MDLRAPVALVRAHSQSTWNQIVRSAGAGGRAVTLLMLGVVALVLVMPAALAFRGGLTMGADLAQGDAEMLGTWNGIMATFTAGFAFLGSFRLKPVFPFTRFGRLPLTPSQLLLAELPASLLEVFPLLGSTVTILLHAGLATRMPAQSPLVLLLALDGVVMMLSILFILAAAWKAIVRRKALLVLTLAATILLVFLSALPGARVLPEDSLPDLMQAFPLSYGYAGLLRVRSGYVAAGLSGIAMATAGSVLLFLVAAHVQRRRLMAEVDGDGAVSRGEASLQFGIPSAAVGRLFLRQLLRSASVRAQIFLPLFFTLPIVAATLLSRSAAEEGKPLPENLLVTIARAEGVPWFAIVPLLAVAMNPQIWMNQFGWDRGGIRTLLLLPLEPRDLLTGKLRGLAGFTATQTGIAVLPLLAMRMPAIRELAIAIAAGGVALLVTTAVGHAVSIRYPRGIDGTSGLQIPLHLGWISPLTMGVTVLGLVGMHAIGSLIAPAAGVIALYVALAATIVLYRIVLPRLAILLHANRERLLAM